MRLARMMESKLDEETLSKLDIYQKVNAMLDKGMSPDEAAKVMVDKYGIDIEQIAVEFEEDGYELDDFRFEE